MLTVTPELIDRGLLVGRYERCAFTEDQEDSHLSRVHLYLFGMDLNCWPLIPVLQTVVITMI